MFATLIYRMRKSKSRETRIVIHDVLTILKVLRFSKVAADYIMVSCVATVV